MGEPAAVAPTCRTPRALVPLVAALAGSACRPEPPVAEPPDPRAASPDSSVPLEVPDPPREEAVGGLRTLSTDSRLALADPAAGADQLQVAYLFPEAIRWRLAVRGDPGADRTLVYRYGGRVFETTPRESASRELLSLERLATLLSLELRRALFLWPDGFEWSGEGSVRQADLGNLGRLVATLAADGSGRPVAISSLDAQDAPRETLGRVTWRETGGRHFPASLERHSATGRIWAEEVLEVRTGGTFLPDFFLPVDRRPPERGSPAGDIPLLYPRVAFHALAEPVPAGADLGALVRRARERQRAVARELEPGWTLSTLPIFALDEGGGPRELWLRLEGGPEPPPDGWAQHAPQDVWAIEVPRASAGVAEALAKLRSAVKGAGQKAGAPYMVILEGRADGPARLVLPVAPR